MNERELRAIAIRAGISIPKLAEKIGISKKTMYAKLCGKSSFNQREILSIKDCLCLNDDDILNIFFADKVS